MPMETHVINAHHFGSEYGSAGYRKRVNMLHEDTESSMNEDEDD